MTRTMKYNPETFEQDVADARDWLFTRRQLLVVTHMRPDGDALGSLFAATECLRTYGIDCTPYVMETVPVEYKRFSVSGLRCNASIDLSEFDGMLCLDCANEERLALPADGFADISIPVCNIDHHIDNSRFGEVNVIHAESASTTELLATLFKRYDVQIPSNAATALMLGLVMDTGGFRFNNTTACSLRCAAELVDLGANYDLVMKEMFFNEPMQLLKLKGEVYNTVNFAYDGRFAWFVLTPELMDEFGVTSDMAEDLIDSVRVIRGVEITCRMQQVDDIMRFSLRSQNPDLPILPIAHKLGGGGHMLAAGATAKMSPEEAEKKLLEYVGEILK